MDLDEEILKQVLEVLEVVRNLNQRVFKLEDLVVTIVKFLDRQEANRSEARNGESLLGL